MRGEEVTDEVTSSAWRPLRVVAHLAEPLVVTTDPLHLDGPLSYGAYQAARAAHVVLPPLTPARCTDFVLPLATWVRPAPDGIDPDLLTPDGAVWGWACSRARFNGDGSTVVEVRKKPPVREFARYTDATRHHDALGPHKARNQSLPARLVTRVTWWALGDPDRVADLLTRVRGLGRVVGHGNGRVLRWTVEAGGPGDRDHWRDRDWPSTDPAAVPGSIRAPYWHPTHRCPVVPGPVT